jgi:hypothetical protein
MLLSIIVHLSFTACAQILSSPVDFENVDGLAALSGNMQQFIAPTSLRYREEKARLLESINHETGEWGYSHPRYKLLQTLHGLYRYKDGCLTDLGQWKKAFDGISDEQKEVRADNAITKLVSSRLKFIQAVSSVTAHEKRFQLFQENQMKNQGVIQRVLENAMKFYEISNDEFEKFISEEEADGSLPNPYRISDILNHLVRDWSIGGPHRRDLGSAPILESLKTLYSDGRRGNHEAKRILLPGAGMGRLAHEIAHLGGFEVTMNEISTDMNVFYRYMETLQYPEAESLYPFVDWWSYQPSMEELALTIRFPDVSVNASDVLLVEGDFMSVFANSTNHFDAVVTLFFIDTAQNMLDYLDTIKHVLKPGGVWINMGSFLYGASPFLHFSLEDFADTTEKMGFRFMDSDEKWGELSVPGKKLRTRDVSYLFNERAYRKKLYEAHFWIAEKV